MLSVIIPVYNEKKYISSCLDSILRQDYPKDDLEVLVVDGMSGDGTRETIMQYVEEHPFFRLVDNPERIVSYAMNKGIAEAKGDIIIRLDAHTTYADNYFSALVDNLLKFDADNVGCVCKTDVLNKTKKSLAIREVLCNKFGVGNSTFRTGIDKVQEVDTVPFGCWRKNVFDKFGLYNTKLERNQDIEHNKRIVNGGGKIIIVPDTYCTYMARETFRDLAENNYRNGKWNILTVLITDNIRSLSLRHFIPLLFVLGLLVPSIVGIFWRPALWLSAFVLLSYMMALSVVSIKLSITRKLNYFYLISSFLILHTSYGFGSLVALISAPFLRK